MSDARTTRTGLQALAQNERARTSRSGLQVLAQQPPAKVALSSTQILRSGEDVDVAGSSTQIARSGEDVDVSSVGVQVIFGDSEQFVVDRAIHVGGVRKDPGEVLEEDDIKEIHRFRRYVERGYIVFEGGEGYYATRHMTIRGEKVKPGDKIDVDSLHYPEPFKRPHRSARPEE